MRLFNDAFLSTEAVYRWKRFVRNSSLSNRITIPDLPGGTEEIHEKFNIVDITRASVNLLLMFTSAHNKVHFLTLYLLHFLTLYPISNIPLQERRVGIAFFFSLALQPPWALASAFQFHDHFTDGRTPWTSDQLVARLYLNTGQHKHTPNMHALCGIRTHDPSFRVSEESSCLGLDRSATVTGWALPGNLQRRKHFCPPLHVVSFCISPNLSSPPPPTFFVIEEKT
jgi:hypothetical protein